jgi:hypothetical protein
VLAAHIIRAINGGSKHLEMSVNFYQTTRRKNPEDSHLSKVYFTLGDVLKIKGK